MSSNANKKPHESVTLLKTPSARLREQSFKEESSSNESYSDHGMGLQEHARVRRRIKLHTSATTTESTLSSSQTVSNASQSSSIFRFRSDFEDMKCKVRVFGESLSLCKCIAQDFKLKFFRMEKRLEALERKHKLLQTESNYSQIIHKNKILSSKTATDLKKLQMCGTEAEMREVAARICRNYLHGAWKTVDAADLDFKRISGGLSNFLYYVALPEDSCKLRGFVQSQESPESEPDTQAARLARMSRIRCNSLTLMDEPKKVLLRIYGQVHGERAMDAIVTESVIFTLLSERRLGPKLHGVFSGGRIEQYIPARPLLTKELSEPALSMKIAEKMAAIHSMDVPLSKGPNWLWKTMGKWMKTVNDERFAVNSEKNQEEQLIVQKLKNTDLEKEIEWLKKFLESVESPVVFCHNDMQEGNILMLEDVVQTTAEDEVSSSYVHTYSSIDNEMSLEPFDESSDSVSSHISDSGEPKLVLIDFEYCAYNYRGFDIANHFQEWCYDYTNPKFPFYYETFDNYPTLEQKEIFIKEYLKHYNSNVSEDKDQIAPTIDEINHLLYEVDAFALASHLFWCLWSIVNASKSQIPFGYWEYALSRLDTYLRLKQEVIKKEKLGHPQKRKICEVDI